MFLKNKKECVQILYIPTKRAEKGRPRRTFRRKRVTADEIRNSLMPAADCPSIFFLRVAVVFFFLLYTFFFPDTATV